ncbi:unnamed protein product [Paramecium primaurelia]|uniref:PARP-type domain-containing protein n=2 Tax=Paramecium TaxID=5884 RepID=A0A8S1UB30_9CILI|nr:unnamed protein product [Paramecium primaurelia]CAD8159866.1 unnamed protein product [Paramecium pentaurelia]
MQQYLEVGYALSNRARCTGCFQNITKNEIRFGHVFVAPGFGYDKKHWYHLTCLKFIPKGDRNQDVALINIHCLKTEDQKKVHDRLDFIKKNCGKKFAKECKLLEKQDDQCEYIKADKDIFSTFIKHMKHKERKDLGEF